MKKQIIIGHLVSLLMGGLVYVLFRQDTLKMFNWFERINLLATVSELRLCTLPLTDYLPNWFLFSLPDGLWLFSYLSILLVVWNNEISKNNIHWLLLVPTIAIASEIGQLLRIIPGTFDIVDLIFYVAGTIFPILMFSNLKSIKFIKHKKNN
jgi:hypothetical protein|tara:strand:- start:260 stop:715 length:456 start_codon:yes stop_codon:yes gene_type:complete